MAWVKMPIQEQWETSSGVPASGYVIKAYLPGTTTATPIAIDKNGATTVSTVTLNADGLPEVSGNEVTLYIDRNFKYAVFENSTDATNNTNPFYGFIDNVKVNSLSADFFIDGYAELRASTSGNYADGDVISLTDDGVWGPGIIKTGTVTDNGGTLIVFTDDSNRYWERIVDGVVRAEWFEPTASDCGAAVNSALGVGLKHVALEGAYSLSTQIVMNSLSGVTLDLSGATITAANSLDVSLIRLLSCTDCVLLPGTIDGNAAGQSSSSFGVDLNGGSYNKVRGGVFTDCKTYGVYIIGCDYCHIDSVTSHNNQQAGIAGDVGSDDVIGVQITNCTTYSNGLSGTGALSGVHIEGNDGIGFYYTEIVVDGLVSYDNRGSAITFQNVRTYTLENVQGFANYRNGVTFASCFYGTGGNWTLEGNDVANAAGSENGVQVDATSVTPASQYNCFVNINTRNHDGNAVLEAGTANDNQFIHVNTISDGAGIVIVGANSIGIEGRSWKGQWGSMSMDGNLAVSRSADGADVTSSVSNTSNTASSDAVFDVQVAGGSAGDPYVKYTVSGVQNWSHGVDNSDSDKFIISAADVLGSNNRLTITTGGTVTIPSLAGSGSRTVVADANGALSAP